MTAASSTPASPTRVRPRSRPCSPSHVRVLEESFSVLTPTERDRFEATLRKLRCQVNPEAVQASDPAPIRADAS